MAHNSTTQTCEKTYFCFDGSLIDTDNAVSVCHEKADCSTNGISHECNCQEGYEGDGKNICEIKGTIAISTLNGHIMLEINIGLRGEKMKRK